MHIFESTAHILKLFPLFANHIGLVVCVMCILNQLRLFIKRSDQMIVKPDWTDILINHQARRVFNETVPLNKFVAHQNYATSMRIDSEPEEEEAAFTDFNSSSLFNRINKHQQYGRKWVTIENRLNQKFYNANRSRLIGFNRHLK